MGEHVLAIRVADAHKFKYSIEQLKAISKNKTLPAIQVDILIDTISIMEGLAKNYEDNK